MGNSSSSTRDRSGSNAASTGANAAGASAGNSGRGRSRSSSNPMLSNPSNTNTSQRDPSAPGVSGITLNLPGAYSSRSRHGSSSQQQPPSSQRRASEAATDLQQVPTSPLFPQDARVDNGHLVTLSNIYPNAPQEWLRDVVQALIVERKLAPFYRGLEDQPGEEDDFDKEETSNLLNEVGDDRSKELRKKTYNNTDRMAEAAMYRKPAECPICFL